MVPAICSSAMVYLLVYVIFLGFWPSTGSDHLDRNLVPSAVDGYVQPNYMLECSLAARLSLKSTDVSSLHNTALALARSNPRLEGLRFFVGYSCDPDHPFNCLFSTCQSDGMCGCNANETVFLGMMCLPSRRLGESCIDNNQCRKASRNSKCEIPRSLTVGVCKCLDGSMGNNTACARILSATSNNNLPEAKDTLESSRERPKHTACSSNQQCLRFGRNAECNLFMQTCDCKPGYRMDDKERLCKDINECVERSPQETCRASRELDVECINTDGGFECACRTNKGRNNGKAPSGICCSEAEIPCDRELKCVNVAAVCDGFPDCTNGYDESFDFCVKPKVTLNLAIPANDTANQGIPSRALPLLNGLDPVDPMPYTQM